MLLDKGGFQLKKLINPCLIAVIAGMVFFIFQIRLPESIDFAMGAMTITMAIVYERDDHYATELYSDNAAFNPDNATVYADCRIGHCAAILHANTSR